MQLQQSKYKNVVSCADWLGTKVTKKFIRYHAKNRMTTIQTSLFHTSQVKNNILLQCNYLSDNVGIRYILKFGYYLKLRQVAKRWLIINECRFKY